MKAQILKLAGVKSEAAFYKKFPSEEAFMKVHGKALKKAAMGASMVNRNLHQLTDFDNPPIAYPGMQVPYNPYNPSISGFGKKNPSLDTSTPRSIGVQQPTDFGMRNSTDTSKMMGNYQSGQAIGKGLDKKAGMPKIEGEKGSDATAYLQAGMDVVEGVSMIKGQNKAVKEAKANSLLTGVQADAVSSQRQQPLKRYYTRPEDTIIQPEQLSPSYGVGTNILSAQDGAMVGGNPTEIQNTYAPNTLYDDLGYEPLNDSDQIKAFYHGGRIPMAQNGFEHFMTEQGGNEALGNVSNMFINKGRGPSAGSKIGGGVGQAAGTYFGGPVGGAIGKFAGETLGSLVDQSGRNIEKYDDISNRNIAGMLGNYIPQQFGKYLEDGGWVSNDWQPQVIAKFGEYDVKDLLKPPADADMLRAGGHLKSYTPPSERAMQTYAMGGDVSNSSLGGVEVESGGYLEPISYNPYNDGTGVTSMIRGQSHDDYSSKLGHSGVMLNAYGNQVEAEGGEPIREMEEGGSMGEDKSAVITGNLVYKNLSGMPNSQYKKYEGKKIKNIHKEIALKDQKLNKKEERNTNNLLNLDPKTSIQKLEFGTYEANKLGYEMQYKNNATEANYFTGHQSIINDTAEKYGFVAEDLAKGITTIDKEALKTISAKWGNTIDKAQTGITKPQVDEKTYGYLTDLFKKAETAKSGPAVKKFQEEFTKLAPEIAKAVTAKYPVTSYGKKAGLTSADPYSNVDSLFGKRTKDYMTGLQEQMKASSTKPNLAITPTTLPNNNNFSKYNEKLQQRLKQDVPDLTKRGKNLDWMGLVNQALPYFRPSDQEPLDPNQISGEIYALSNNQVDPVQAQTFQPQLQTPYDISYQDQINEITAQTRQAERLAGNNPEALAAIYGQATMAKNRVLGEQLRVNQGTKAQTYAGNIDTLNNAQLKNLQAYAVQQGQQETAKSITKATTQAALDSVSSKFAQNKLANRQLSIMENMYNYRYDKSGRAINMNPLVNFDEMIANASPDELTKYKALLEAKSSKEKTSNKAARNGSIVKAIKNL